MTARTRIRPLTGMLFALATAGLLVSFPAPATAASSEGPCAEGTGVTVVVDFSDVGGSTTTGCATGDPETGRDALAAAGFASEDSTPGMICTIDALPDPCPETFDGSYWSYWHALPGEAWTSYLVGADTSAPVRGEIEGWRYNDGSVGPGDGIATDPGASTDAGTAVSATSASAESSSFDDSGVMLAAVAAGFMILLIIAAGALGLRRRKGQGRP